MNEENKRRIVELEDESGIIFPQTHISAVIDSSQRSLDEILEDLKVGNIDLSGIKSDIIELQNKVFPLTSTLTLLGRSVFEYTGYKYSDCLFKNTISFRGEMIDRNEIEDEGFKLTVSEGIEDVMDLSNNPEEISFSLSVPDNFSQTGIKNYSASLNVKLKNGKTTEATCNFSQIAASWVGWSDYSEVGGWMTKNNLNELAKTSYISKLIKTNLSGSYSWDKIEKGKSFWIIVPNKPAFSGYITVMTNGIQVVMANMGTYSIGGIDYICFRNNSGPLLQNIETGYKITLSND